jgi:uncharacterized protein YgiM (DUF1202 family)
MKNPMIIRPFLLAGVAVLAAAAAQADMLRVEAPPALPALAASQGTLKADKVNVRSRPDTKSEVIIQLNKGDTVEILGRQGEGKNEWLKIALPAKAKCYVSSKLIADGAVTTDGVNVRCGPGTNFKEVGKLAKGARVEVVAKSGDWTQIKPTASCSGWIAAQFVDVAPAPVQPPEVVTPPVAAVPPAPPAVQVTDVNPDVLVSYVVKNGILKAVADRAKEPAAYELMTEEVGGREYRIAYVESTDKNLAKLVNKPVRVMGNQRWRKGERDPVIVAERIERAW